MALRWTASEPGVLQYPILDIDRAQNWTEFNAALARFPGPGSNFVYADVDGNIGYHAAGTLPIRRGFFGQRAARRRVGQIRMGWIHSLRRAAVGVQSAQRDHRDGQPEPVSR